MPVRHILVLVVVTMSVKKSNKNILILTISLSIPKSPNSDPLTNQDEPSGTLLSRDGLVDAN